MAEAHVQLPNAVWHAAALVETGHPPTLVRGYLDLLDDQRPHPSGAVSWLMHTKLVPTIYERWWRPIFGQAIKGPFGPSTEGEFRLAKDYLRLEPGDVVVDVACGPGNFTRALAEAVGERGLAIGVDASTTMLERAVVDTHAENVAYLHADATELPLRTGGFDAVGCFLALHLFDDPMLAVERMAAVLAPGGRLALFTSCGRGEPHVSRALAGPLWQFGGARLFGRHELTDVLAGLGFVDIKQQVHGFLQFVGARKPD
ncbi:MAG TPA: methyltransferase domain-containing protein [Pseudonocardiaceae bacterium]|jgi:SAM-dependent methyltransferase|nr:methyltransferase domain-containing protein [Pseudonocardiaceae bacterium]